MIRVKGHLGFATGTHQANWGILRNTVCEKHGIVPETHLAHKLKEQDYSTAHIGKCHIGKRNIQRIKEVLKRNIVNEEMKRAELS